MKTILTLTAAQLRMYLRDRQSVFLSLFFPLMLMTAFGFITSNEQSAIDVGIIDTGNGSHQIRQALEASDLLSLQQTTEEDARTALEQGDLDLAIILPPQGADLATGIDLKTLVNAANPQASQQALAILDAVLNQAEHDLRGTEPLFAVNVEDIEARSFRYIDFLIPGLLAFMTMQLAVTGSGFNIVEYKRKGILKRLFVTPLAPYKFIASLIAMRLVTIVVQLGLILGFGILVFQAEITGNLLLMTLFVIAGGILFLALGFALGGIATTQNAIILMGNLFIFPQVFLASVFFPIDQLPGWLQGFASLLPLTFLSDALRQIANEGAGLADLGWDSLGIAVWAAIGLFLAIRFFRWGDAANT